MAQNVVSWMGRPAGEPVDFEGREVEEDTFLEVLDEAVAAIEAADIPYVIMGGVAVAVHGRNRWTHDLDIYLRDRLDASRALDVLAERGFAIQETNEHWLYKAIKRGVLVDLIFKAKGDIYLDDEMLERASVKEFKGRSIRVIPPEDLVVIKAVIHDEQTPRHWYDALSIIAAAEIDWDYLLARSIRGPRRLLSLLVYAESNDLVVPERVIRSLFSSIYDA
jgi:predicted nucleotidyltransferase